MVTLPKNEMLSFRRLDLLREKQVKFDEEIKFTANDFADNTRLNEIRDCRVSGKAYFSEELDLFSVDLKISGIMIVPCAMTLRDVSYPFNTDMAMSFSFRAEGDDDVIFVKDKVELLPEIIKVITAEVPLRITAPGIKYQKGKNWEVISETAYLAEKKVNNPALAELAEYEFEDEEE